MQQRFLLQILLLAQHVSGTTMSIIRSSRVLYSGCCLWYFVLWFSSCWSGAELRVMCPVCRILAGLQFYPCEISGFRRDMVEGSAPWDVARHRLAFGYRRFGTTSVASTSVKQYKNSLGSRTFEDGTDVSQHSLTSYQFTQRNMAEERKHSFLYISVKASPHLGIFCLKHFSF